MIIFGQKPMADMTVEEMMQATEHLRSEREALRNEAVKEKAAREAKGFQSTDPKIKRERKKKEPSEADMIAKQMLDWMRGGDA